MCFFEPKIWIFGAKSHFFCMVIAIFVNRAYHKYAWGHNSCYIVYLTGGWVHSLQAPECRPATQQVCWETFNSCYLERLEIFKKKWGEGERLELESKDLKTSKIIPVKDIIHHLNKYQQVFHCWCD